MPTVRVFHVVKPLPRFGSGSNPNPEPLLTLEPMRHLSHLCQVIIAVAGEL